MFKLFFIISMLGYGYLAANDYDLKDILIFSMACIILSLYRLVDVLNTMDDKLHDVVMMMYESMDDNEDMLKHEPYPIGDDNEWDTVSGPGGLYFTYNDTIIC